MNAVTTTTAAAAGGGSSKSPPAGKVTQAATLTLPPKQALVAGELVRLNSAQPASSIGPTVAASCLSPTSDPSTDLGDPSALGAGADGTVSQSPPEIGIVVSAPAAAAETEQRGVMVMNIATNQVIKYSEMVLMVRICDSLL